MPTTEATTKKAKITLKQLAPEILNRLVNILMIGAVYILVTNELTPIALIVLLLSKWRIFSTRQLRAIPTNALKSSCDIVFGISLISLMDHYWVLERETIVIALTAIFLFWQIILRPMSSQWAVATQSLACLVFGFTAVWLNFPEAYNFGIVAIILSGIIGYVSAFHSLRQFHETTDNSVLLSMTWTMITVEYAWLSWLWNIHYGPVQLGVRIPQIALVLGLIGYFLYSLILVREEKNDRSRQIFIQQSLFVATLMAFILFFTEWNSTL